MNMNQLLIKNQFIAVPHASQKTFFDSQNISPELITVINNFIYYGYIPSIEVLEHLQSFSSNQLVSFWKSVEKDFKEVTGASKKMEKFVVYKNFPKEVLDKEESEYWFSQICIYFGVPTKVFAEKTKKRPALTEKSNLKVLALKNENTLPFIFDSLIKRPNRWTDEQKEMASLIFDQMKVSFIDIDRASFKENAISFAFEKLIKNKSTQKYEKAIQISNATDVLRLAAIFSDSDVSLKDKILFKFKRSERKFFLNLLNRSHNLMDDVSLRPELFKRFLKSLHPGDYSQFSHVQEVYDKLYNHQYETFASSVEKNIQNKKDDVFQLLKSRPGEFFRKLHHIYKIYGSEAIPHFKEIISSLTTIQLLKISKYIETINDRQQLMFAPKGNWTKVQLQPNFKNPFLEEDKLNLLNSFNDELIQRLSQIFPEGVDLDLKTKEIKLQTNDQELAPYGRGTSFDIPENIQFIRSASYWSIQSAASVWYDNSWNFFDKNWNPIDTCCWSSYSACNSGAIFSGDPVNTQDIKGRACQMIDLYLDKLEQAGVQYAVWNILAYNHLPFEKADVLATLQYGENPEKGKLYEPSRAQIVFPLQGDNLSKYIAYIDVPKRKLVYIDANLYGNVSSAQLNGVILQEKMPAYLEYLNSLPSVFDLFKNAPIGNIPVLYSDKNVDISSEKAFVFRKENNKNSFKDLNISEILTEKTIQPIKKIKP